MVLHLNASDERGLDVVRKQIIQFASTALLSGQDAVQVGRADEADSMTGTAQMALRDMSLRHLCLIGNYRYALLPLSAIACACSSRPSPAAVALGRRVAVRATDVACVARLCADRPYAPVPECAASDCNVAPRPVVKPVHDRARAAGAVSDA